ncbi:MAG: hypothetical protein GEV11_05975 [Streptosporangiales bacterium]|nr:hypothetical protein [Streptosporangiales bacterium]
MLVATGRTYRLTRLGYLRMWTSYHSGRLLGRHRASLPALPALGRVPPVPPPWLRPWRDGRLRRALLLAGSGMFVLTAMTAYSLAEFFRPNGDNGPSLALALLLALGSLGVVGWAVAGSRHVPCRRHGRQR